MSQHQCSNLVEGIQ